MGSDRKTDAMREYLERQEPREPEIVDVELAAAAPSRGGNAAPVLDFSEGRVPRNWLWAGPFDGAAASLADDAAIGALAGGQAAPGTAVRVGGAEGELRPLPGEAHTDAGCGHIRLSRLAGEEGPAAIVLYGVLENRARGLFRVHLDRLRAVMVVGGRRLADGDFVRLGAGRAGVVVLADGRKDYSWDHVVVRPRLTPCTEADVAELTAGRKRVWDEARAACADGRDALRRAVSVLPGTLIGVDGFVRVGRCERGFWWFVDAGGRPFFYQGVTSINRAGRQGGRRAVAGPYAAAVDAKYDYPGGPDRFVDACLDRLEAWGFNGLGSWTTAEFFERRGFFYTDIVEFNQGYPRLEGVGFVDVFDPGWLEFIDRKAREICAPQRNNRLLVGYFTENEIGFPTVGTIPLDAIGEPILTGVWPSLLQKCLAADPRAHACRAAWRFTLARHGGDAGAAARAWGVASAEPEAVRRLSADGGLLFSDGFRADADSFACHYAEQFFRCSALAIRRHDPNHLVLGCRWGGPPQAGLLEAESRWTDVISLNNYQDNFRERLAEYHNPLDLPMLVGEFCWNDDGHMTIEMPFEPRAGFTPWERMVAAGTVYLRRVFRHPNIAGWTWYRWVAENPLRSPRTCGLVDDTDDEHPCNPAGLVVLHALAERERLAARAAEAGPVAPFAGRVTVILRDGSGSNGSGRHRRQKLVFGAACDGRCVAPELYGYGVRGAIRNGAFGGGALSFEVEVAFTSEIFCRGEGSARYRVTLDSERGGRLAGRYEGMFNGEPRRGEATGWLEQ